MGNESILGCYDDHLRVHGIPPDDMIIGGGFDAVSKFAKMFGIPVIVTVEESHEGIVSARNRLIASLRDALSSLTKVGQIEFVVIDNGSKLIVVFPIVGGSVDKDNPVSVVVLSHDGIQTAFDQLGSDLVGGNDDVEHTLPWWQDLLKSIVKRIGNQILADTERNDSR